MASKKQKFNSVSLIGKSVEQAINIVYSDIDYTPYGKFYWLSVPTSFDNQEHFIRFPYGTEFYMEHKNGIITKIY